MNFTEIFHYLLLTYFFQMLCSSFSLKQKEKKIDFSWINLVRFTGIFFLKKATQKQEGRNGVSFICSDKKKKSPCAPILQRTSVGLIGKLHLSGKCMVDTGSSGGWMGLTAWRVCQLSDEFSAWSVYDVHIPDCITTSLANLLIFFLLWVYEQDSLTHVGALKVVARKSFLLLSIVVPFFLC